MARNGKDNHTVSRISWNFGEIEGYQFAGTAETRIQNFEDPAVPDRYWPKMYYTLVKPLTRGGRPVGHDGKLLDPGSELCIHAVPMISNFDKGECKQDKITYKWKQVTDLTLIHDELGKAPQALKCWLINQKDGFDVKYWYGIQANPFLITSYSQSMATIFKGMTNTSPSFSMNAPVFTENEYGTPPSRISVDSDPLQAKAFRCGAGNSGQGSGGESGWFRHACLHTVEYFDNEGILRKRTFMICYDVDHRFYAFPVTSRLKDKPESGQEGLNVYGFVPMSDVISSEVPWPNSVDQTKIGKNEETQYRPDWSFSHDGKHAVCIARIIDPPWTDQGIVSSTWIAATKKDVIETTPILVEIKFELLVTGDLPEQFSFEIQLARVIDPRTTGRSIVSAQYAVKDFKSKGVKADDLIILEYVMRMTDLVIPTGELTCPVGDGAHLINVPAGNQLIKPNLTTIAKIKNLKKIGIEGSELFKWCAYYSSEHYINHDLPFEISILPYYEYVNDPSVIFYHANRAIYDATVKDSSIQLDDWSSIKDMDGTNKIIKQTILYHAAIQTIELSTLSFVISAIMNVVGNGYSLFYETDPEPIVLKKDESISGVSQWFVAFGEEVSREYKGKPFLKQPIENLFDLADSAPPVENYKRFDLLARINSQFIEPTLYSSIPAPEGKVIWPESIYVDSAFIIRSHPFYRTNGYQWNSVWWDLSALTGLRVILGQPFRLTDAAYDRAKNHQKTLTKANTQTLTINYGYEVTVKDRVFNCANVKSFRSIPSQFDQAFFPPIGLGDSNYLFNYFDSLIIAPKIFNYFDSIETHRPGTVYHVQGSRTGDPLFIIGEPQFFDYPFGKVFFNRVYHMTMNPTNNLKDQIRTHPNGSYAIFTLPMIAFKDRHSIDYLGSGWNEYATATINFTKGAGTIETEQLILDKIHLVYEYQNKQTQTIERFTKDTTHVAMLNLAFKKTLTIEDYYFGLQAHGNTYSIFANLPVYSGGLSLTKKWTNPSLVNAVRLIHNGYHDQRLIFKHCTMDQSKVIGCDLLHEYVRYPQVFRDFYAASNSWWGIQNQHISITYNPNYENAYLGHYCPTPRMESLFYFNQPYINRKENNE